MWGKKSNCLVGQQRCARYRSYYKEDARPENVGWEERGGGEGEGGREGKERNLLTTDLIVKLPSNYNPTNYK